MVHVSAPGKLMIAGEWAILELGNSSLVAAINRRVHSVVENSDKFSIELSDFQINVEARLENKKIILNTPIGEEAFDKIRFVAAAIETSIQYLNELGKDSGSLKIKVWGDPTEVEEVRTGFGYFASAIVAVVGGILSNAGVDISEKRDILFKLSSVAYYKTQGRGGSAYNIAAAAYGGTFVYRRFDGEWLKNEIDIIESGREKIANVVGNNWPGFYYKNLPIPKGMIIEVGITGEPVSAMGKVKQMLNFKKQSPMEYDRIYSQIRSSVEFMITSVSNKDKVGILDMAKKNAALLRELGEKSGIDVETPRIRRLIWIANRHGAAGKLSGAGKSDMGIAICFDKDDAEKIKKEWEQNGIMPFETNIEKEGIQIEK